MLYFNDIGDATMDRILNWLIDTSLDTLQHLYIDKNSLRRFPAKISLFKKLEILCIQEQTINENGIRILPNGSYARSGSLKVLKLNKCGIEIIEAGAFTGILKLILIIFITICNFQQQSKFVLR